jgi:ribosomal RNA-processing protein 1
MSSSFAKRLADSDKRVRDKTFVAVSKWLSAREHLSRLDGKKLWRGLFYSFWHADGRATQLDVANKMGAMIHGLSREVAMSYARAFAWTMRKEWSGIDKHRMDKYFLLSRRVTHHALRFAGERGWDCAGELGEVMGEAVFGGGGKDGIASSEGIGYKLHLAEVFLNEIECVAKGETGLTMDEGEEDVASAPPMPIPSDALSALLVMFIDAMQREESAVLQRRIRGNVFEPLTDTSRLEDLGSPRLTPKTMKALCERAITLGAENGVEDVCRESLYELHALLKKGASKMAKEAEALGIDPEADVCGAAPKKTKKKNGVVAGVNGEKETSKKSKKVKVEDVPTTTEKKKKKKKQKRQEMDEGVMSEEEAKKEKKRRKKERRLAKEMEALARESAEAEAKAKATTPTSNGKKHHSTMKNDNGSKLVAMRAVGDAVDSPTTSLDSGSSSPSKRLVWNDDAITYSTPHIKSRIDTSRGKSNLKLTPSKTLLRPIHAAASLKQRPSSAPIPGGKRSKSKSKLSRESFF